MLLLQTYSQTNACRSDGPRISINKLDEEIKEDKEVDERNIVQKVKK